MALRDVQPRAVVLRQPDSERPHAADREEDVVGSGTNAEQPDRFLERGPGFGVGRHRTEHDVGVSADIFGCSLNADVDTLFERAMK